MSTTTTYACDKCGTEAHGDDAQKWYAAVLVDCHTVRFQEDDDCYDDDECNFDLRLFGHSCRVCHAEMVTKIRELLMEYGLREDDETERFYRHMAEPRPLPE